MAPLVVKRTLSPDAENRWLGKPPLLPSARAEGT